MSRLRSVGLVASLLLAACAPAERPVEPGTAAFDWFEYSGRDAWFDQPAGQDSFRNPILAGFYPDPSIVRVDETYYLVTSTFAWYPGVPVFRSTDLVNWEQIGHVLDRPSLLPLQGLSVSRGVFAPTIRYHDGLFYMITTLVEAGGNFYVTATDPAGPWSELVWLPEMPGIDPSLFFDDDGRVYVVHNGPPDYEPLYQGHTAIWIQELDLDAGKLIGPRKVIVDGGVDLSTRPIWVEGPHLFRVGGWYYLIAAEGGTELNHSEVVFRSRDPFGPYEPGPVNPILTQRTLDPDRPFPVIATGHADFVQTPRGGWWAVFLGCRPYEGILYNTGRETFLHPVSWSDGWPMILDPSRPVPLALPAPDLAGSPPAPTPHTGNFTRRDEFDRPDPAPAWNSLRGPSDPWLDLESSPGAAILTAGSERLTGSSTPAFLARRQQHASFSASTALRLPGSPGVSAGLAAFQNERHHFYLGVRFTGDERSIFLERAAGGDPSLIAERDLPPGDADRIELRIEADGRPYTFSYRLDGAGWVALAEAVDGSILSTEVAKGFVGSYIGLHARVEWSPSDARLPVLDSAGEVSAGASIGAERFPLFILVSLVVFVAILRFVTRTRASRPSVATVVAVAVVVVIGGMVFAKFGQNTGWPWWVYYTVPAAVTLVVPPLALRLSASELWQYLALAALSSPLIHVLFSFFLGWHEYMPFIPVPSLRELSSHTFADPAADTLFQLPGDGGWSPTMARGDQG